MDDKKLEKYDSIPGLIQLVIFFQIFTNIVVLFNIPYLRQIIGFLYLTFIPGLVIVKVFNLSQKNILETLILAIGLDIAFLLFVGLLLNELLPIFGLASPLSTNSLLIAFNIITMAFIILLYYKKTNVSDLTNIIKLSDFPIKSIVFIIIIPLLSILGVAFVNGMNNNSILLLMLVFITIFISMSVLKNEILPPKLYLVAILAITFALIFHIAMITNYFLGWDFHSEYQVFELVNNKGFWDSTLTSVDENIAKGYSMLSVTILPTIYSKIIDINGTIIFKLLYPLMLALIPMVLYIFYSERMDKKIAYLSILFFISNLTFFGVDGFSAKQIVGEFFYVLLFMVIMKNDINAPKKWLLFTLFGIAMIISYYSLAYILLFFIFLPYLILTKSQFMSTSKKSVDIYMLFTFFVVTFTWYTYSNSSAQMNNLKVIVEQIVMNFGRDFFDISTRSTTVLRGIGLSQTTSFLHQIGSLVFYVSELLILIGFIKMFFTRKNKEDPIHLDKEYYIFASLNLIILFLCIAIPNFARFFRAERFYQTALIFLAPFFVLGGNTLFQFFLRIKKQTVATNLILIILVPFLLFQTGFIYEVTDDYNYSLPLSMYRMDRITLSSRIIDAKEVTAASWLSNRMNHSNGLVYGDFISTLKVLTSYGMLSTENFRDLSNTTRFTGKINYIYLREVNTLENKIIGANGSWNSTDVFPLVENRNNIYSNGASKIFFWGMGN
jgi:uncharacterized membrane protein